MRIVDGVDLKIAFNSGTKLFDILIHSKENQIDHHLAEQEFFVFIDELDNPIKLPGLIIYLDGPLHLARVRDYFETCKEEYLNNHDPGERL